MSKIFNIKNILIALLVIALCVIGYWYYNAKDSLHVISSVRISDSMKFTKIINDKGIEVAEQAVLMMSQQEQLQAYGDSLFNMEKNQVRKYGDYIAIVKANQVLTLKLHAHYIDTNNAKSFAVNDIAPADSNYIKVPAEFVYESDDMVLHGTVKLDGVDIDSDSKVYNTVAFRLIDKQKNIFHSGVVLDAINSNKMIEFTGVTSIYAEPKQSKWSKYIKPAIAFIVGAAAIHFLKR